MANIKRISTDKNQTKTKNHITIKLDPETLLIYNRVKPRKSHQYKSMSEWFRNQIWFHFSKDGLNPQQKNQRLREEIAIAAMVRKKATDDADKEYFRKVQMLQREMSTEEVSVVINED